MDTNQETENIPKLYVVLTILFIVVTVIVTFVGAIFFVQNYKASIYGASRSEQGTSVEINLIKSKELAILSSYKKIGNDQYRIPIDKAIKELVD